MNKRIIFHIDVNNAFLSWTAVLLLKEGYKIDIRKIPSIIGGDENKRHGIVLAKSPIAKKYGIKTAETLYMARKKCPNIQIFPPNYSWYYKESFLFHNYLKQFTPNVEKYSVDEAFLDFSGTNYMYKDYILLANQIKDNIKEKYGFTVNVGIGNNMLCAKMASDFEKPNKVHTLFQYEIERKMWPLSVADLFMVGKSSSKILISLGIKTIGDLAHTDINFLRKKFKSQGDMMHNYANGIDFTPVNPDNHSGKSKSISVTETLPQDTDSTYLLKQVLMKQAERVGRQARYEKLYAKTIAIIFKTGDFVSYSHQLKVTNPTNVTSEIYKYVVELLDKGWRGEPLRLIGIRLADFTSDNSKQLSLFDKEKDLHNDKIQEVMDDISEKYGDGIIIPASLKQIGGEKK